VTDIGIIKGAIELQDDFTSQLGLAKAALSNFSKENQESLKAVAGAAGLVAAAFGAVAAATVALANRGADVNDLTATIEHFAGGATEARAAMDGLRQGTLDTVDNFSLAERASHLLSAGVKLTAEDFETLGASAIILSNRGLGDVKSQLELVSDAMVTGKTKALEMAIGVVDVEGAEEAFAVSLGITREQLSETGKVEARRIAILDSMRAAVKDAGAQERDFGEQLQAAKAFATNLVDELASALASSEVFATGMREIGNAVSAAFSGDKKEFISTVVETLEQGAIVTIDFGLAAVEMARVINTAWSAVKTIVLGVTTGLSAGVEVVLAGIGAVASAGEALNILPEGSAATIEAFREQVRGMTDDLNKQTAEAAKGVVGQSEFDKTLDNIGGTLFTVRDAMVKASQSTDDHAASTDIAAENTKKLAGAQEEVARSMIDRAKIMAELAKLEKKSIEETVGLWADYAVIVTKSTQTSGEAARAQIKATFDKQVAALDDFNPNYKAHYAAIEAVAEASLQAISTDWDSVKDKSIEGLREQAARARETYNQMATGSLHFTRDALQEQLEKVRELEEAARGMGDTYQDAFEKAAVAAAQVTAEAKKQEEAAAAILKANRAQGGSMNVTRANIDGLAYYDTNGRFVRIPKDIAKKMAERGFSAEEIILAYRTGTVDTWVPQGPRIPGFAQGGTVDIKVGENGPEVARVPLGTTVFPTSMTPVGGGVTLNQNIYVNGTAEEVARKINKVTMDGVKSTRQMRIS